MHPDPEQLHGFVSGTLDDETADRLADHVEQCEACEQTVRSLESASDTFIDSLRTPVAADPLRDEPECREMIEAIRAMGQDRSQASLQAGAAATDEPAGHLGLRGQYELLEKLGEGGMGAVYKARHTELDKIVAVKVLSAQRTRDPDAVARFKREMRAVGKLEHPNIVRAMDAGEVDGEHFLAMEYVKGADLSQLVKQHGPLPIADACELIRQAAVGLDEAHDHGIVHRDIKPSNLILARQRRKPPVVKILDMGLARLSERESPDARALTSAGQMMGTLDYMAPEQGQGTDDVDIRADIYGLGATLYKLLCGQAPFGDKKYDAPINKLMALATAEPPSIAERREGVPAELAAVVHKMLAKDPSERYATPADVVVALTPFAAGANLAALAGVDAPAEAKPIDDTSSSMSASTPTDPTLDIVRESSPDAVARPAVASQPSARRPFTRPPYLIAAAAGALGVVLLGVLLTLRFGDVVVTVETPDGKLPDDVKLLLKGDGQPIEITSDKKWKVNVSPGNYGVEIQGGSDQFTIQEDTLMVSRGGKNILVVRRNAVTEVVGATRIPPHQTSGSPTPTDGVAGESRPTDAQLLQRLASVDWKPGKADDKLRGVVASPAVIDGIAGAWQICHGCGYYGNRWVSPKGNYVVLAHETDSLGVVFENKTGRPVGAIQVHDGRPLQHCSWSGDESQIAYCGEQSRDVHIVGRDGVSDYTSFPVLRRAAIRCLGFSPDGTKIAVGAGVSWESLVIYSSGGELLHAVDKTAVQVNGDIRWSPDGRYVAVAYGGQVQVFEVEDGQAVCLVQEDGRGFRRPRWSPDGQTFYVYASSRKGEGWSTVDMSTGGVEQGTDSCPVTASPGGRLCLWQNGEIRDVAGKVVSTIDMTRIPGYAHCTWDEPNRIRLVSDLFPGHWVECSPTDRVTASGSRPLWMPMHYGTWLKDDERITAAHAGGERAGAKGRQFTWSVDGTNDATIELARGGRGSWGEALPVFNPLTGACAFSGESQRFLIFDGEGNLASDYEFDDSNGEMSSSFSPDGSRLALYATHEPDIIVQNEGTVQRFAGLELKRALGLGWNVDGSHLCGWDKQGNVCVWDARDGRVVKKYEGMVFGEADLVSWHQRWSTPRWSPDGTRLAMFSADALHVVSAVGDDDIQVPWDAGNRRLRDIHGPIWWTPNGKGFIVRGKVYRLDGQPMGKLGGNSVEFEWLDESSRSVGVEGNKVRIWPALDEPPVEIAVPGSRDRARIRPKDLGFNVRRLSPSGRYLATIAITETPELGLFSGGDLVLVDLQEQKVVWTGIGYSDGTMIRVGESGQIISGPDDIDPYLIYTIRYPEGVVIPLTQLQFAARVGLSPAQQCVQRILDLGGTVQLAQRETPLARKDLADARDLPKLSEVVGISLSGNAFANADTLEHLKELTALATLDLSSSRVEDVDLGVLLDLASLRTLNLAGTQVTNNVGAALPAGLEELDLSGTAVSDLLLTDLRSLKSLRRLVLTDTKTTDAAVDAFRQARPACDVVR